MPETRRILLADDEEIFLRSTAAILAQAGYSCTCAMKVEAVLEALNESSFDLLITDLQMPGNEDLRVLAKAQVAQKWLPIIVVTAYPSVQSAVQSLRMAVVDYLVKPIDDTALLDHVANAIGKGLVMRQLKQAQEEMSSSASNLGNLSEAMLKTPPAGTAELTLDSYLEMTLANIMKSAASLRRTMEMVKTGQGQASEDLCQMVRCPRLTRYQDAVIHTVSVLEKTKDSFRSKELAALRKTLLTLLAETDPVVQRIQQ